MSEVKNMSVKLVHAGIVVSSIKESVSFYEGMLGFKSQRSFELPPEIVRTVFGVFSYATVQVLSCDSGTLELFQFKDVKKAAAGPVTAGLNHFAVETEDLNSFIHNIKSKGGKLKSFSKDGRTIWFAVDPDGTLIELKETRK